MLDYGFGVQLGPLDSSMCHTIREWRNDVRIRRWCRQSSLISDREQQAWFESQTKDPSIKMFAIHSPGDGRLVGVCGLTSIDNTNRRAEFSLYIAPSFHGSGFGKMALKTLVTHGFRDLNLNSIWGESFQGNPAEKMFQDVGFKFEGKRREFYFKDGKYIDALLWSLLAKDFK